jgi:hypothetical protein
MEECVMKRIISPVTNKTYNEQVYDVHVEIEFKEGKLSMHGVGGALRNGNCLGSCGQNMEEVLSGTPKEGWTPEMVQKLVEVWDRWHLNDMNPLCEHQRAEGWREIARKAVNLYHFMLTREASSKKREVEKLALEALKNGESFSPTAEQTELACLDYGVTYHTENLPEKLAKFYEPQKALWQGATGFVETKTCGWLYEKDHPEGILGKPCSVCGYEYGSSWIKEEVPQEIIDWLFSLPEAEKRPAWI